MDYQNNGITSENNSGHVSSKASWEQPKIYILDTKSDTCGTKTGAFSEQGPTTGVS